MSRSKWKTPYVDTCFLLNGKSKQYWSRDTVILPSFIGKTFNVHNGKNSVFIRITVFMIGYKLGEFVPTKKVFKYKK